MQYEFRGKSLTEAVSKATGHNSLRFKSDCSQVHREIRALENTLGNILERIEDERNKLERLKRSRNIAIAAAAGNAVAAVGGPFASVLRAGRIARRALSGSRPSIRDFAGLLPGIGGGIAAIAAGLSAYDSIREISEINNIIQGLAYRAEGLERYIPDIRRMADRSGCNHISW